MRRRLEYAPGVGAVSMQEIANHFYGSTDGALRVRVDLFGTLCSRALTREYPAWQEQRTTKHSYPFRLVCEGLPPLKGKSEQQPSSVASVSNQRDAIRAAVRSLTELFAEYTHIYDSVHHIFSSREAEWEWAKSCARRMLADRNMVAPLIHEGVDFLKAEYEKKLWGEGVVAEDCVGNYLL